MPRIQLRRDTAANWTSSNPTLSAGEIGFETDTGKFKIGTGSAAWSALSYFTAGSSSPARSGSTGTDSVAVGANTNDATANYSIASGGQNNVAAGVESVIVGGANNFVKSRGGIAGGINNLVGQNARRANSVGGTATTSLTALSATPAVLDNTTADALEIRYTDNSGNIQTAKRTVVSATQNGDNVALTLSATVGPNWNGVAVLNTAETDSNLFPVSFGHQSVVSGTYAVVSGGKNNTASGSYATVAAGLANTASASYATVSGGYGNEARDSYAIVAGGNGNGASAIYAVVSGGVYNAASGLYSTISGGASNAASNQYTTVSGGQTNTASASYATVSGGYTNAASNYGATVSGGTSNTASNESATVAGGSTNTASGYIASVSGGHSNTASGNYAVVSGGYGNTASNSYAIVAGGGANTASNQYTTILGGSTNTLSGKGSACIGSVNSDAGNDYATLLGQHGAATTNGQFVFSKVPISTPGDAQGSKYIFSRQTIDSVGVYLRCAGTLYGGVEQEAIVIGDNQTVYFKGMVVARRVDGVASESNAWTIEGLVSSEGGLTTLLYDNVVSVYADNASLAIDVKLDGTEDNLLRIEVQGISGGTFNWAANVDTVETIGFTSS